MCAKKTPTTTPTKQNALTGVTKLPVKKVVAQKIEKKQTTKTKADDSFVKSNLTSAIVKDLKANVDAKKPETKSPATSNKKANKTIVTETKASNPSTPIKAAIKATQLVKDTKKALSRDSSADNAKGKKLPINGKTNKVKVVDGDRDKSGEDKSNHIRDNKITVKNDEVKSKSNSTNEQCNKFEKSSSSLSLKPNGESDNVIKEREKLCKKGSDKAKPNVSPATTPKKVNNRNNDEGSKKSADKPKSSKIVKKANKEKESKIKISNELKNLGIEMSKSNSSLAVVIQEGLSSIGVKTSICEMVKTKARYCSNLNNSVGTVKSQSAQARKNSDFKINNNKTNKESQEKVLKDSEAKAANDSVDGKKTNSEQFKSVETPKSDDEKKIAEAPTISEAAVKTVIVSKNKISALVNAKNSNKIKSSSELQKCENVNKANELEPSKPAKRKYVKKKKLDDAADSSKNSASASETDARNNDKIDQNKSTCLSVSDGNSNEIKSASKIDTQGETKDEISVVAKKDKQESSSASESTSKSTPNKTKQVSKVKNQLQEGSKVKKAVQSLSADEKSSVVVVKVDAPTVAAKIKRKYVKKVKPTQVETADESNEKLDAENSKVFKVERDKSSDTSELKKSTNESQKNGLLEKKPKSVATPAKDDSKKTLEKVLKPTTPKKDLLKVESQEKIAKNKTVKSKVPDKKPVEKVSKITPKKQKIEIKKEEDLHDSSSSESENSSHSSDSDSELTEDTFKKPNKPSTQRNLRNKKQKQIACKRTRVASLNASARVHCLYENEARSALEAANIAKAIKQSCTDGSSGDEDEAENESQKVDLTSMR